MIKSQCGKSQMFSLRRAKSSLALNKKTLPILGLIAILALASTVLAEEGLRDSRFHLKDYLASGKQQFGFYENKEARFTLRIPEGTQRKWHFVVFNDPEVPFYIVCENTILENLPFISSNIFQLPPETLNKGKEVLFQEIALQHTEWERDISGGDIKFINKGSQLDIAGYAAFERIFESPGLKTTYHMIYIIFDNMLLQLGINAKSPDFASDDRDFTNIINTLETK